MECVKCVWLGVGQDGRSERIGAGLYQSGGIDISVSVGLGWWCCVMSVCVVSLDYFCIWLVPVSLLC